MDGELEEIGREKNYIYALLSQDLHDFACHGHMIDQGRRDRFEGKLKHYAELSKIYTDLWQKKRGYK